jgi:N-acetylneuraminate lyase
MFWGVDEMLLGALAFGARAAVGSTYNVLAPIFCRLIECFNQGDLAAARQWQDRAIQFVHTVAPFSFHPAMKEILGMLGIEMGPCRLPLPGLSTEGADDLRRQLDKIEFFEWCSVS